jgi:16S rRNA (adenine1518-N6/adenine1519-N6)-dimethyltransferase
MISKVFPKKSLGQNFLIDKNVIKKIVKIPNFLENKIVLEIGSGNGNLTNEILKKNPKKIIAIEKDKNLAIVLKDRFIKTNKVEVVNDDIFNVLKKNIWGKNIIIFGNLPYNISTQILASLITYKKWPPWYDCMVLMFQKEVADRILAKKNSKEFGRFAILCNWRTEIKKEFDVSCNCFYPKPKVDSTMLSFYPKKKINYKIKDPKNLEFITRILFSNRRKMINKNLIKLFGKNITLIKDLNLDVRCRPEEISSEVFYKIAIKYEKLID